MSIDQILNQISEALDTYEDLDPSTFVFNPPVSKFSDDNIVLDLNKLISTPDFNECASLAGHNVKLNSEQKSTLRTTGKINVPSVNFPGQYHVWQVSSWLQTGTDNIKESFFDGIASSASHFVIGIPD